MRVSRFHEEQIVRLLREQELSVHMVASFIRRNDTSTPSIGGARSTAASPRPRPSGSSAWSARMPVYAVLNSIHIGLWSEM